MLNVCNLGEARLCGVRESEVPKVLNVCNLGEARLCDPPRLNFSLKIPGGRKRTADCLASLKKLVQ